jgi:hypothetical protein
VFHSLWTFQSPCRKAAPTAIRTIVRRAKRVPAVNIQPPLRLASGNHPVPSNVTHYNYDRPHQYLGDWLATDMQMKTDDEKLFEKPSADAWSAAHSRNACIVPAMTYTFAVTHHSANRLRKIQSSPTRSTLLKLGFNRNTAHAVAYGPSRYGALGLRNLPVEQSIAGVTMLICHLRARSTQGTLALIALSWWQLRLGTSKPPLEDPQFRVP